MTEDLARKCKFLGLFIFGVSLQSERSHGSRPQFLNRGKKNGNVQTTTHQRSPCCCHQRGASRRRGGAVCSHLVFSSALLERNTGPEQRDKPDGDRNVPCSSGAFYCHGLRLYCRRGNGIRTQHVCEFPAQTGPCDQ